jgi:hypothetical protein
MRRSRTEINRAVRQANDKNWTPVPGLLNKKPEEEDAIFCLAKDGIFLSFFVKRTRNSFGSVIH